MAGSATYLPNLTGVRGLAALWVLALHAWQFSGGAPVRVPLLHLDLTPLFACGYFGVDLFFVLSGFLLSMPFHRAVMDGTPRPSLRHFWIHRCRRVLPAYWLQLAILSAVMLYAGRQDAVAPRILFAHAALIQNIVPWPVPLLNPVYWSMPVEWDFYLALPLLAWLFARSRWPVALLLAFSFAIAFRVLCYRSLQDPSLAAVISYGAIQQLPARVDQFVAGIGVAWIVLRTPLSTRGATASLVAGLVGIVLLAYEATARGDFLIKEDVPYLFFHHSLTAIAFGLIVLGAAAGSRPAAALFANRPMTWLGLISYSLYLWHYPLLELAQFEGFTIGRHMPAGLFVVAIAVPAILLIAWLSYQFVERPFLKDAKLPAVLAAP